MRDAEIVQTERKSKHKVYEAPAGFHKNMRNLFADVYLFI